MSNGKILFNRKQVCDQLDSRSILENGVEVEIVELEKAHTGPVNKLITIKIDSFSLLLSGGSDAIIRIWEPLNKKT